MKIMLTGLSILFFSSVAHSGQMTGATDKQGDESLASLIDEALVSNPEIQAAIHEMGRARQAVRREGALDDPMIVYMREDMPGFRWDEPSAHKIEFLQTVRFPTKLSSQSDLAEISAEHAHHIHLEKVNEVVMRVKVAYYDMWYAQESVMLNRETARLLTQFAEVAKTKYRVGERGQQDVLTATVELARIENRLMELEQEEESARVMLKSLLNRGQGDGIGAARLDTHAVFLPSQDTLQALALRNRPMLIHDSLTIVQKNLAVSLAKEEYLPDLILGVEYVNRPDLNRDGWSVKAGITMPFFPWTLGKAGGRVSEAEADMLESRSSLSASRNMVSAAVRDQYLKVRSAERRLEAFDRSILPQARQAFEATLVAYQTGRSDFLTLIDSYRTLVDLSEELLGVRREYETAAAMLEREVGMDYTASIEPGRGEQ